MAAVAQLGSLGQVAQTARLPRQEQENPAVAPRADLEVVGVEPEQCYVTLEGRMTRQGLLPAFCVREQGAVIIRYGSQREVLTAFPQ